MKLKIIATTDGKGIGKVFDVTNCLEIVDVLKMQAMRLRIAGKIYYLQNTNYTIKLKLFGEIK